MDLRFLSDDSLPDIAVLGLGRMGSRLAGALIRQGFPVTVWNRTPERADALVRAGAATESTAARAARHADVVLLALTDADAVREVLLAGTDPVVGQLRSDAVVVDLTTTGPRGARAIAAELQRRGVAYVEAPVVGSPEAAGKGTLTTLAGGPAETVSRVTPVLESWTAPGRLVVTGPVGSANALRVLSVTTLAVALEGIGESLRLAQDMGLDRSKVIETLRGGILSGLVTSHEAHLDARDASEGEYPLGMFLAELSMALYESGSALPAAEAAFLRARVATANGKGRHDAIEVALSRENREEAGASPGTVTSQPAAGHTAEIEAAQPRPGRHAAEPTA